MNLLLNASNLRYGGGRTIALQLIDAVAPLRSDDKLYVVVPQHAGYEILTKHPNVTLLPLPDSFHRSWLIKLRYIHRVFPRWCRRLAIDKVVSLGNIAFPARRHPQLVYLQLPQLVYHESPAWKTMDMRSFMLNSLMDQYVALHMRYATSYAVQTEVMRARLSNRFKLPGDRVYIIPNAAIEPKPGQIMAMPQPMRPLKLLFLSRYYPHKNFECLPAVARLLWEREVPAEITLTINEKDGPGAAKVLQSVSGYKNIINIGHVAIKDVSDVVAAHHGVFLPSLMESFSGVYAEAILHRRLIFTSHYDFATELVGEAAFYFDPMKPENIVSVIAAAIDNPSLMEEKLRIIASTENSSSRIADVARAFSGIIDTFA